jgi:ubiquinone biosynthesis protein
MAELKEEIANIRSKHLAVKTFGEYDSGAFAQAFVAAANRFRIKLAPEYTVLSKAGATIEGIIRTLAPDVDVVGIARPYAEGLVRERFAPHRLVGEAIAGVAGASNLMRHMPAQVDQLLHDLESGNLQIRMLNPGLDDVAPMVRQLGSRLSLVAFAATTSVCAAVLLAVRDPLTIRGVPVLASACLLAAFAAWTVAWWWHFVGLGRRIRLEPLVRFFRR